MSGMVVWMIRRRAGSAMWELRAAIEQVTGGWREQAPVILATSKESARALVPFGSLLLFPSEDAEFWAPWWAPEWWWPDGQKPRSMWNAPPERVRWPG